MNEVISINEVDSLASVASDLSFLMGRYDNNDIFKEFPVTAQKYSGDVEHIIENFENEQGLYSKGRHEVFVSFVDSTAVGLSIVANDIPAPPSVDPVWPNLSSFVCAPFRGRGIGRMSLGVRMRSVADNFNNQAWTIIRDGNGPSEHLILDFGFRRTDIWIGSLALYLFNEK